MRRKQQPVVECLAAVAECTKVSTAQSGWHNTIKFKGRLSYPIQYVYAVSVTGSGMERRIRRNKKRSRLSARSERRIVRRRATAVAIR